MAPSYSAPPFANRGYLVPGLMAWSFGSFNDQEPPTDMQVTGLSVASDVATLSVTILRGDAPKVGSLISTTAIPPTGGVISAASIGSPAGTGYAVGDHIGVIQSGGQNAILAVATEAAGVPETYTVVAGGIGYTTGNNLTTNTITGSGSGATVDITASTAVQYNVTNVALLSASFTGATGTVTYALNVANLSETAVSGYAIVPQPLLGQSVASGNKGAQFAIQSHAGGNKQHGLTWMTQVGGSPSGVSISLEIADVDQDASYTVVDTSTSTSGETRSVGNITANFARIIATTITGGSSPTLAAGIMVS